MEEGDQAVPGGGGVLQGGLALLVGAGLQLVAQEARRVGAGVHLVVGGEQAAFLGEEEEDQAHHDRDRAAVDLARADAGGVQAGRAVLDGAGVGAPYGVDEEFDGLADLDAEGLGDVLAGGEAGLEEPRQRLGFVVREEAAAAQQGGEGADDVAFGGLVPADGVEDGGGGDAAERGPDQAPPAAVGDEAEGDAVVAQQAGQAVGGGRGPVAAGAGAGGGRGAGGHGQAEEADVFGGGLRVGFGGEVGARFDEGEVGADLGVVLGDAQGEAVQAVVLRVALAEGEGVAPAEQAAQDVGHPLVAAGDGVGLPVGVAGAQPDAFVLLQGVELGPGAQQDGHGEEGAGDLGEVQPLLVLPAAVGGLGLGGGDSRAHGAAGAHRRASFAGTAKTTAAGKRWERGSR
ncbi:hypothetical protein LUX01_01835 [Streptomyces sudanensis]|uniref:hypothetical protein n=1 Tax=Streptomyces sudanensis TaxID=436397 RepID=UPI0020CF4E99|nr:hypothetical protein [Streptomyces sudanensis]MCP9985628.1 hypothetical protein [Streptomyces sudanensis]